MEDDSDEGWGKQGIERVGLTRGIRCRKNIRRL
jgi:hypothetical protein